MKIWIISDTHKLHNQLEIPKVDMVIHCGDEADNINTSINHNESCLFFNWMESLPIKHKVFVAGNHSSAIYHKLIKPQDFGVHYLEHEEITIDGLRIFGSPYTPRFGNWDFMYQRHKAYKYWNVLPEGLDILITHGPGKNRLDLSVDFDNTLKFCGCSYLSKRIEEVKPKIHCFGHVHDEKGINNFGQFIHGETKYINASCYINRKSPEKINPGHIIKI